MAFATYTAATNDFRVTVGLTNNSDYIFYNNTKCALVISFPNGGVNLDEFVLEPGECHVHHQTAATLASAANNVNGRPVHTAVGATDVVDLGRDISGDPIVNESQARLVVSSFA